MGILRVTESYDENQESVLGPWGHCGRSNLNMNELQISETVVYPYVLSFSVTGMRNLKGYRFPSTINRAERKAVEKVLRAAITSSSLGGKYVIGTDITPDILTPKIEPGSDYFTCDWPYHRLLYTSLPGNVNIIVNHTDHLCIKVTGNEGEFNVKDIMSTYTKALSGVETELNDHGYSYMYDSTYGYHTSNPFHLGTAMIATVTMCLPLLIEKSPVSVMSRLGLTYVLSVPVSGEGYVREGQCEISHVHRMGCSEAEQIQTLMDGVKVSAFHLKFISSFSHLFFIFISNLSILLSLFLDFSWYLTHRQIGRAHV